jgi:hypothetical protein
MLLGGSPARQGAKQCHGGLAMLHVQMAGREMLPISEASARADARGSDF